MFLRVRSCQISGQSRKREKLSAFRDEPLDTLDHEAAAIARDCCIAQAIAVSTVAMSFCAAAPRHHMRIFTTDPDFTRYAPESAPPSPSAPRMRPQRVLKIVPRLFPGVSDRRTPGRIAVLLNVFATHTWPHLPAGTGADR